ncbi:MAG: AI-2E family transporter [Leptospiraceae bacterium]|nr:AI-2E family transporter [Leptospiraceae bacterium]
MKDPEDRYIRTVPRSVIMPYLGGLIIVGSAVLVLLVYRSYAWPAFLALLFYAGFQKPHSWILSKLKQNRTAAATVSTVLIMFVLLGPVSVLTRLLILQAIDLLNGIKTFLLSDWALELAQRFPGLVAWITDDPFFWVELEANYVQILDQYSSYLDPDRIGNLVGGAYSFVLGGMSFTLGFAVNLVFGFILMFFLFRDAPLFYRGLESALPFPPSLLRSFVDRMKQTISAVLVGNVFVSIMQGVALGIGFAICGVPNALLYGSIAVVFSIIPIVGTSPVWLPASVYLAFIEQRYGMAIFLAVYGLGMFLFLENIVKPKVLDKRLGVHPMFLFFSILGGLKEFGITGIFLGPLFVALFVTLWKIYHIWDTSEDEERKLMEAGLDPASVPSATVDPDKEERSDNG